MDNMRRFPAPWLMEEDGGLFRVRDVSGFTLVTIVHRDDLHTRSYQYAESYLSREEARRIAKSHLAPSRASYATAVLSLALFLRLHSGEAIANLLSLRRRDAVCFPISLSVLVGLKRRSRMHTHFVYRNWRRSRGRVHLADCSCCNHGKGTQPEDSGKNGEWQAFDSREAAFSAANNMNLDDMKACAVCAP
jgi:hypothetical protein